MAFGTYLNEESDLGCGITTLAPKFHKPELSFVFYDRRIDAAHLMHAVDLDPEPIPALEFDQTLG